MDKPIHTFFKYLKEDDTKYISHDCITRYYEMLRYLMKHNTLFGGKKPIENLYKYKTEYKNEFLTSTYTFLDIILFETKIESIKDKYLTDSESIKSEKEIILNSITNLLDKSPSKKLKPQMIVIPSFILSTVAFIFMNQHIKS